MELKETQRKYVIKNVKMLIRCSEVDSAFMKKHNISPQLFFDTAFRELKEKQINVKKNLEKNEKTKI